MMNTDEILDILSDKNLRFNNAMNKDVQKILIIQLLLDPLFSVEIFENCYRMNKYSNDKITDAYKDKICDNLVLYEIMWIKYVSSSYKRLPINQGIEALKIPYFTAISTYQMPYEKIIENDDNGKPIYRIYDIINKNAQNTALLFDNPTNYKSIMENMNYYDIKNGKNYTFLHHAIMEGIADAEMINYFANKGANVNKLYFRYTALILAAEKGMTEVAEALINNGVDINVKNRSRGSNALMYASGSGSLDIVNLLLDNGADVNSYDEEGNTPLLYSLGASMEFSKEINKDVVKTLINRGANINHQSNDKYTPLMFIFQGINPNILELEKFMLDNGADPNIQNDYGKTTLTELLTPNYFKYHELDDMLSYVKLLLKYGADPTIKDKKNKNALGYSLKIGNQELTTLLHSFT